GKRGAGGAGQRWPRPALRRPRRGTAGDGVAGAVPLPRAHLPGLLAHPLAAAGSAGADPAVRRVGAAGGGRGALPSGGGPELSTGRGAGGGGAGGDAGPARLGGAGRAMSDRRLEGKRGLVTGAGSGLGAAMGLRVIGAGDAG